MIHKIIKKTYSMLVMKMEIKPTLTTTNILTTVINEKPTSFACVMGNDIRGTVCFYPFQKGTIMIYEINGLPKNQDGGGIFGFHIHEGETCINDTNVPFEKALGHFNPNKALHPFHLGDLPPLFATQGMAWGMVYIDKFTPQDIINRTVIVHASPDDFHTQPAGNSGTRIACGEIKKFMN